jgi:hypothetical protein
MIAENTQTRICEGGCAAWLRSLETRSPERAGMLLLLGALFDPPIAERSRC